MVAMSQGDWPRSASAKRQQSVTPSTVACATNTRSNGSVGKLDGDNEIADNRQPNVAIVEHAAT
jgi:hypothetical protein